MNQQENLRRVGIITGAATGIGRAIARRLAADGCTVIGIGRTEATLKQLVEDAPAGTDLQYRVADVSDPDAITSAVDEMARLHGRLDILVNNAGLSVPGTVEQTDPDSYRAMMATNIDGTFFASRAALPHLRRTHGCIVNVGSVGGLRGDWGQAVYDLTKAAVTNLTNAMALDHGHEIRVNAVHPGVTLSSDFLRQVMADDSPLRARFADRVPLRRPAEPAEIAAVVAFLVGPDASYLNGVHIPVDGGLTASNGQADLYQAAADLLD